MHRRYLTGLADLISRWHLVIVSLGVLLAALATWHSIRHLEFKSSRNDLIGRDSEYWRLYSEYAEEFQAEEDYLVVVESDHPERNRLAVDALVKELLAPANNPSPKDPANAQQFAAPDVFHRVDLEPLEKWFLYYLSVNELTQIRDSIADFKQLLAILQHRSKLDTFFDAMNRMLLQMEFASPQQRQQMIAFLPTITGITKQMGEQNVSDKQFPLLSPWANAFFSEEMLGEAEQEMKWNGYHVFRNGSMYVILVHPRLTGAIGAPAHHAATVPKLRRILKDVHRSFSDVRISLTGEPVLDCDEMEVSQRDAKASSALTIVLIALVVVFGFRDWLRMLLSIGCLLMVIGMTMGYTTLVIGHLNIITITFAVMILGLGEDLGVQFISRYEEELGRGGGRFDAVRGALRCTGPSIVVAGVTNAAAFFAMGLSGFRGVTELGVIAGGGMLLATLGMLVLLPALLLSVRRRNEPAHLPVQVKVTGVERFLLTKPWATVGVCGALTVAALIFGWRARFDYNVLNLQSRGVESVETEVRLLNADAESTIFASVVCDTFEEARTMHHRLEALPTVAAVHSIAELIPEDQKQKSEILREIQKSLGDIQLKPEPADPADAELVLRSLAALRMRADKLARDAAKQNDAAAQQALAQLARVASQTREALQATELQKRQEWLAKYEQRFYADLETQLQLMAHQSERAMEVKDVPPELRRMLIGKTGKFLVRVFPKENIWERDALVPFVSDVQGVAPKVTGTPLGLYEFVEILLHGYIKAALWAFLVIAIMVFIDLRSVPATALTLLPLLVGTAWMIGAIAVLGIRFNPANILTLPLMVGIGVAYGIYIVQRYREDGQATFYGKSTGRAVMLSGLTAVIAFGSLLIGAHRGIRSLGLVMSIGVMACLLASLTLLPALLEVARRKGWKV